MISVHVQIESGVGEIAVQLVDGIHNYACLFDCSKREVRLLLDSDERPLATAEWPKGLNDQQATIEMSIIDQQIIVVVDGESAISPFPIQTPQETPVPRVAARIAARGLDVVVDRLLIYRDVFYTSAHSRNAVNRPLKLNESELFVLGDNSPVSHDSRRWDEAPVDLSLLLGKPFLVHLPSKPGRIRICNSEMHVRLPDFARMRFLK